MSMFLAMTAVPSLLEIFTYWFFLFRFLFSSRWVKLASGDIKWRNLRALAFHYETVYRYTFGDSGTRKETGKWWNRTLLGASSVMTLQDE